MTELTASERGKLADTLEPGHVQLSIGERTYLIDMDSNGAPELEAALTAFITAAHTSRNDQAGMFSRMIAAMTPPRTAGRGLSIQAQRNAEARAALQEEFGLLTSADVANSSGARAKNTSALDDGAGTGESSGFPAVTARSCTQVSSSTPQASRGRRSPVSLRRSPRPWTAGLWPCGSSLPTAG